MLQGQMANISMPCTSKIFADKVLTEDRRETGRNSDIYMLSKIQRVDVKLLQNTSIGQEDLPTWSDHNCPCKPMMEMQATVTMKNIMQMTMKKTEEMQAEIMEMMAGMMTWQKIFEMVSWIKIGNILLSAFALQVIILIVGVVEIPVVQIMVQVMSHLLKLQEILLQIAALVMLWKIMTLMLEISIHLKSQTAHMSRSEYNTTALGGLGMRLLDASLPISTSISRTW